MAKVANSESIGTETKQCRICFESHESRENHLISPCQCRGSVQYMHEKCIKEWISRVIKNCSLQEYSQILKRSAIDCEICHQQVVFSFSKKYECKSCRQIGKFFQESPYKKIIFLVIMLLIFALFLFVIAEILGMIIKSKGNGGNSLFAIFGVLLFSFLVCFILSICLILQNTIISKLEIDKIGGKGIPQGDIAQLNNEGRSHQQIVGMASRTSTQPALNGEYFWDEQ